VRRSANKAGRLRIDKTRILRSRRSTFPGKGGGFELQPTFTEANRNKPTPKSDFSRLPTSFLPAVPGQVRGGLCAKKKADVTKYPKVLAHVGLLINGPALNGQGLPLF
jgi:hypothetical protein